MKIVFFVVLLVSRALNKVVRESRRYAAIRQGLSVGEDTFFVGGQDFGSEPYLIRIGRQCLITDGVRFITHDGGIQVPFIKQGCAIREVYSKKSTFGRIDIGDNVFVGVGSIFLPNTSIGSDSIVAAGAIVKGAFPNGVVIGGNPAKVICRIDEYFDRNRDRVVEFLVNESRVDKVLSSLHDGF